MGRHRLPVDRQQGRGQGDRGAIALLEMTGQSLGFRAPERRLRVPYAQMLRARLEDDDFRKVIEGARNSSAGRSR